MVGTSGISKDARVESPALRGTVNHRHLLGTSMSHWPITLDDAIRIVLHECPERTGSTIFVSQAINERRLYVQKDGGPVFPDQIFLRARNYPDLFRVLDRTTIKSLPAARKKRVKD
jgi:hypothetical protein